MNCLACDKKLREINEDSLYSNWNRKYHKKCWNKRHYYSELYEQSLQFGFENTPAMKNFLKRSCC